MRGGGGIARHGKLLRCGAGTAATIVGLLVNSEEVASVADSDDVTLTLVKSVTA